VAVQVSNAIVAMEADHFQRRVLEFNTRQIMAVSKLPAGSVLFCSDRNLLHNLQFVGDYLLYPGEAFEQASIKRMIENNVPADDPQGLDPGRREAIKKRLGGWTQKQLDEALRGVAWGTIKEGRQVFVLDQPGGSAPRDRRPRALAGVVTRLTSGLPAKGQGLYGDTRRELSWRVRLVAKNAAEELARVGERWPGRRWKPRQQRPPLSPVAVEWRVSEISGHPLQPSPEQQALLDFEARQKAAVEKAAAQEKAKQEKLAADRAVAEKARQEKIAAERAAEKERAQRIAAQKAALAELISQRAAATQAIEKLAVEKAAAETGTQKAKAEQAAAVADADKAKAEKSATEAAAAKAKEEAGTQATTRGAGQ
jgi:hypothetical protein